MRVRIIVAVAALGCFGLGYNAPAHAIGCISGGIAGAAAGHMAHHGVLGAIGGCVAGHEYHKHEERERTEQRSEQGGYPNDNRQAPDTYRNND